jgi:hypothetical protein
MCIYWEQIIKGKSRVCKIQKELLDNKNVVYSTILYKGNKGRSGRPRKENK